VLNHSEIELIQNKDLIIAKRQATEKIVCLFAKTERSLAYFLSTQPSPLPYQDIINYKAGKISKGENHNGYPWVVLDFPYFFSKESIFTFRTFFWWGNFICFSFMLSGHYFDMLSKKLIQDTNHFDNGWYYSISNSIWDNSKSNVAPLSKGTCPHMASLAIKNRFIKLSTYLEFKHIQMLPQWITKQFTFVYPLI